MAFTVTVGMEFSDGMRLEPGTVLLVVPDERLPRDEAAALKHQRDASIVYPRPGRRRRAYRLVDVYAFEVGGRFRHLQVTFDGQIGRQLSFHEMSELKRRLSEPTGPRKYLHGDVEGKAVYCSTCEQFGDGKCCSMSPESHRARWEREERAFYLAMACGHVQGWRDVDAQNMHSIGISDTSAESDTYSDTLVA
jgi:hypothetical protein